MLLVGVAVVVMCAVSFAVIASQLGARTSVLQVARPVAAGHVLAAQDLTEVQTSADPELRLVPASDEGQVVGRPAAVPLLVGALLTDRAVGSAAWPPAGQVAGSVALKAGRVPEVAAGQHVVVYIRPTGQTGTASGGPTQQRFGAVVVDVQPPAGTQDATVLTLLMPAADGDTLAQADDDAVVVMRGGGQ